MGLRDMLRRSAKAVIGEVVDRVLEGPGRRESPPPVREPVREPPAEPPERREPPAKDPPNRKAPMEEPPSPEPPVEDPPPDDRPLTGERPTGEPPAGDRPSDDRPPDEPILTRTMAGVLAAQGYHERALRIYDHLVTGNPEDGDLAAEAGEVRLRMEDEDEGPPDEVAAVPVRQDTLLVSWKVTDRSVDRARRVLGGDGELATRVVMVARDPREGVRSETLERTPVDATGEHVFDGVPKGARCTASVGLRRGERFVSVAHSRVVPT